MRPWRQKVKPNFKLVSILLILLFYINCSYSQWQFDWNTRTDRDGKQAGIYEITPIPITEGSTTYSITNDEGTKTFFLGSIYFVDNNGVSNGSTTYDPATRTTGSGSYTVYSSIANAFSAQNSGNVTLLVRDGTYYESGLRIRLGTDDSHRYIVAGYNQERPVIDAGGADVNIFSSSGASVPSHAYFTLQRLKVQNTQAHGMQIGTLNYGSPFRERKRDTHVNLIDMEGYRCGYDFTNGSSGSFYFMNADNAWLYHCTSGHAYAHAFKIADGSRNSLTEWSVAYEFGYWDGVTVGAAGHPSGFDYPDVGYNHELRYSICHTGLFYGIQVRGNDDDAGSIAYEPEGVGLINIHHTEIYNTTHFQDVTGESGHVTPCQVLIYKAWSGRTPGNKLYFHNNIIRDGADSDCRGLRITGSWYADSTFVYNNLIYNNPSHDLQIVSTGQPVYIYNNSLYNSDSETLMENDNGANTTTINNVFYQAGSGDCTNGVDAGTHSHNLYYALGTGGYGLSNETSWQTPGTQDFWISVPIGAYSKDYCALKGDGSATDKGADLMNSFRDSFNGIARPFGSAWDIGAYEFKTKTKTNSNIRIRPVKY